MISWSVKFNIVCCRWCFDIFEIVWS